MLLLGAPMVIGEGHEGVLLLRNFHPPEDGFAWSSRRWCEVEFDFNIDALLPGQEAVLSLDMNAFQDPLVPAGSDVLIFLNGMRLGSATLRSRLILELPVPDALLRATRNVLTLDAPDAARPSEFGREDNRLLGVQLYAVGILEPMLT